MTDDRTGRDPPAGADERDAVRRGYDELAASYAAARSDDPSDVVALGALLNRLPADARLLDAGCGQGDPVLARLADAGTAVGLDVSASMLDLAREAVPAAPLVQGDLTALPFDPGGFDAVTAYHSLIHVPLADHERVLAEFARVLAPGGLAVVSEGGSRWVGSNPDWLDSGVEMRWQIAGAERTREQLRAAGFEVVREWTAADDLGDDEETGKDDLGDDEGAPRDPFFLVRLPA